MKMASIKRTGVCAAVCAAICADLSGCSLGGIGGLPPKPQISSAYSAECTVTAPVVPPGGTSSGENTEEVFTFSGNVKRLGTGFWEMEITAPETLSGMKITTSGENVDSRLGDLCFSLSAENMPSGSPFMSVFRALDSAAVNENALTSGKEGGWVMTADTYTIVFDGEGTPVSMAMSDPRLTVEFSSFSLLSATLGTSSE